MARYVIPAVDGVVTFDVDNRNLVGHQLSVSTEGVTAGELEVKARGRGATVFEPIPDGLIDLAAPVSVLFTFAVAEYQVTLSSFAGSATEVALTDTVVEI